VSLWSRHRICRRAACGIACPWLIRRFVDRNARFLFVQRPEVADVAEKFDAIPFDMENGFWCGSGQTCTFDTMIERFQLGTEVLSRLATVIRGAAANRRDLAPQSAGLRALSHGLLTSQRDDLARMTAGMTIFDALYQWARGDTDRSGDRLATPAGN
jgi:hypothetical protein